MLARTFVAACGLFSPFLSPVVAQQFPGGMQTLPVPLPAGSGPALLVPGGTVFFDGTDVQFAPTGQAPQSKLHFPAFRFGSFLLDLGGGQVLFGESSGHTLWRVGLGTAPAVALGTMPWNYDATRLSVQHALVSARLGGFAAPDNELIVLDLATGTQQVLARVTGASGPVEIAANGDLYYATGSAAFPTPPGTARIVRFRAATIATALQQNAVLTLAQAELVWSGLDSAADLALDDDGDLHFTDWFNARLGEINDADTAQPTLGGGIGDYAASALGAASLQFVPATGGGVFEPYQPVGGTMLVLETDYFATSQLREVRAVAPELVTSVPGPQGPGPFALITVGGPSLGIGLVAITGSAAPGTLRLAVPGFEQPLWWSAALAAPLLFVLPLDVAGNGALQLVNPGFVPALAATAQVASVSVDGVLGASAPLPLLLQ